jgi:transposase
MSSGYQEPAVSVSQVSRCLSDQGEEAGLGALLPHLASVVVEKARVFGDLVRAWVRPRADGAACPGCQAWCAKVHGSYTRTLADAGIGGRRVLIHLVVRLLRCGAPGCGTVTFAEQPAGLAAPYARRTPLLTRELTAIAKALAGRAGARLARVLAVEVSRHTLIRLVMSLPDPPAALVRVLGVDDFSLKKGSRYATLLADMETGQPVDVLPGREAATLRQWLEDHPGTEVICRDRGTAYAQAARDGAPGAIQVADRWHLWHNLCEHAARAVARHKDCLGGPACRHQEPGPGQDQAPPPPPPATAADLEAVIRQRHQQLHQLLAGGATLDQAAAALGLTSQTAGRYQRAADAGALLPARAASALDPWKPHLHQRAAQGITSIQALYREITAAGYAGSYTTLYDYAGMFKLAAPPRPPAPPTHRQAATMILRDPARLTPGDQDQLTVILTRCPQLDALARHIAGFAKILTRLRGGGELGTWLDAVDADDQPDLHSFTTGIRQDYTAVANAMSLHWNSGPVEGRNTRTKFLERQMYGRATFPLLRKRILTC